MVDVVDGRTTQKAREAKIYVFQYPFLEYTQRMRPARNGQVSIARYTLAFHLPGESDTHL